jgi:hypothetical protein
MRLGEPRGFTVVETLLDAPRLSVSDGLVLDKLLTGVMFTTHRRNLATVSARIPKSL